MFSLNDDGNKFATEQSYLDKRIELIRKETYFYNWKWAREIFRSFLCFLHGRRSGDINEN